MTNRLQPYRFNLFEINAIKRLYLLYSRKLHLDRLPEVYLSDYAESRKFGLAGNKEKDWDDFDRHTSETDLSNPDFTYHSSYDSFEDITYKSETGQDYYYLTYAYFLKKRYAHDNYQTERENLLELYNSINDIYAIIARGGTFFSHNKPRIQAYAEWDIYNHLVAMRAVPISEIDFELEKEAFIERNRKMLEPSNSFEYWGSFTEEERKATLQELQVLFESLSEKIGTPFYLSCVLGFEERYEHLLPE